MDNDLTENAHWTKLPGTVDFFFSSCLFAPNKGLGPKRKWNREVKCCSCERKMDQWSGVFDTVKKSHVGDNVRLGCSNTRLLILGQVMVYLKVKIKLKSH